jgi:hypothetical protein
VVAALLVSAVLLGLGAVSAAAGTVSRRDRAGDVKAKSLSARERRALDIVSVTATGDEPSGLFVTVTFKGDVERYLGQGHLKRALIALVLVPKSSKRAPAGLVDEGGGFTPKRLSIFKRVGSRVTIKQRTMNVFGQDRVLRKTASSDVGAILHHNQVLFYIAGPGLSNVAKVQVKAFTEVPARGGRRANSADDTIPHWVDIYTKQPTDLASLGVDPSKLSCDQHRALLSSFRRARDRTQQELNGWNRDVAFIKDALRHNEELLSKPGLDPTYIQKVRKTQDDWQNLLVDRGKSIGRVEDNLRNLERLIEKLSHLLTLACEPPSLVPMYAVFDKNTFSTVYYENVRNVDRAGPVKYQWAVAIPADPRCATGFQPNRPKDNQATWYHADVSEGGVCNHSGTLYDATGRGHPGTVVVQVSNEYWNCTAMYYGTQGDNGGSVGEGSAQPCQRR